MKFSEKPFVNDEVTLDGNIFDRCRFEMCKLVYFGGPPPSFTNCTFIDTQILFDGSAANTLGFLQALSAPGSGFEEFFATMFPNRRVG